MAKIKRSKEYKNRKKYLLHIYNRGNRKEKICRNKKDFIFLYNLIHYHFRECDFDLLSFCIMPNHYHILAKQRGCTHIGEVMRKISSRFTRYVNDRYSLKGHLFQGKYKTKLVTNADQFLIVHTYIQNNLIKIGLNQDFPLYYSNEILIGHYYLDKFHTQEMNL